jgi:hypothetical protein
MLPLLHILDYGGLLKISIIACFDLLLSLLDKIVLVDLFFRYPYIQFICSSSI